MDIEYALLKRGYEQHGGINFILNYMNTARNDFAIGINSSNRIVPVPYGSNKRMKSGYNFLTKYISEQYKLKSEGENISDGAIRITEQALRLIQTVEAENRRRHNKKFHMKDLARPIGKDGDLSRYNLGKDEFGQDVYFDMSTLKMPEFSPGLEGISGDFGKIQWNKNMNKVDSPFNLMNDAHMDFYYNLAQMSDKADEFAQYLELMNGLNADMMSTDTINPIKYLAVRSNMDKNIARLAKEVFTSGIMDDFSNVNVRNLKANPLYILMGGHEGDGFFKGISLENKQQYSMKYLKQLVKTKNELTESADKLGWKTEKSQKTMDDFLNNCGVK